MSNYNALEELINEQVEQTPEKEVEKSTPSVAEPEEKKPEVVPPPPVPQDDSTKVKNKAFKEKINSLKSVIEDKEDEIAQLKSSIREINKRHQMEKEAILADQLSAKKALEDKEKKHEEEEAKLEKKKEKKDISSKKKMAIIVVVIIFVVAVVAAIFISKRRSHDAGIEDTSSDVHDSED